MCTRFVYHGDDMITGFNFDIDLSVWKHKVIEEKERFYIGILPTRTERTILIMGLIKMEMLERCYMCTETLTEHIKTAKYV